MKITLLLTAIAALFIGCGTTGTTGGGSTYTEPTYVPEEETIPISVNGNQILLPGYGYDIERGETYELHVLKDGNVLFSGSSGCSYGIFDANYNEVLMGEYLQDNRVWAGKSFDFKKGLYYLTVSICSKGHDGGFLTVESNVL